MMSKEQVHEVMMDIYESWRYNWCSGGACACMGGANCSGQVTSKGVTKEQWEEWVKDNPDPSPTPKSVQEQLDAYFAAGGSIS